MNPEYSQISSLSSEKSKAPSVQASPGKNPKLKTSAQHNRNISLPPQTRPRFASNNNNQKNQMKKSFFLSLSLFPSLGRATIPAWSSEFLSISIISILILFFFFSFFNAEPKPEETKSRLARGNEEFPLKKGRKSGFIRLKNHNEPSPRAPRAEKPPNLRDSKAKPLPLSANTDFPSFFFWHQTRAQQIFLRSDRALCSLFSPLMFKYRNTFENSRI